MLMVTTTSTIRHQIDFMPNETICEVLLDLYPQVCQQVTKNARDSFIKQHLELPKNFNNMRLLIYGHMVNMR